MVQVQPERIILICRNVICALPDAWETLAVRSRAEWDDYDLPPSSLVTQENSSLIFPWTTDPESINFLKRKARAYGYSVKEPTWFNAKKMS